MADTYTFALPATKSEGGLADAINYFFSAQKGMETQVHQYVGGKILVQARDKIGAFKQWIGMDKAISVQIERLGPETISVNIGQAKWIDKVGAITISMFFLWPLMITSGIGIYQQGKLPGQIKEVITRYLTQ